MDPSLYLFSRYTLTAPLFTAIFYRELKIYLRLLTYSRSDLRSTFVVQATANDRVPGATNRRPFAPPLAGYEIGKLVIVVFSHL